jgi:RNA polymerase sigma-70 factor (ECF subfamily)
MTETFSNPNLDALLEHGGWVRALARSLVADGAAAEDLEQKAWLAAIEKSEQVRNPKSWLGGVVRNLAGMHWREQKARRRREEVVGERRWRKESQDAASEQPDGLTERMETFRILAVALGSLQEPYGTALYLRFFEELTMREIAQRMSVPESTTKARISRGLEMLRSQLESSLGSDWRAQCLVFTIPLAKAPAAAITTVLVMTLKAKLFLAAGALALSTLFILDPWSAPIVEANVVTEANLRTGVLEGPKASSSTVHEQPEVERTTLAPEEQSVFAVVSAKPLTATLRLKVIEEGTGNPLPGIEFDVWSIREKGLSDKEGVCQVEVPVTLKRLDLNISLYGGSRDFRHVEDLSLVAGEILERSFTVPKRYQYTIFIQSPDGEPFAHREVRVSNSTEGTSYDLRLTFTTDENGALTTPFMLGRFIVTVDKAPDGLFAFNANLNLTKEDHGKSQTLVFFRSRKISLRVQDEDQNIVNGASLDVWAQGSKKLENGQISPNFSGDRSLPDANADGFAVFPVPTEVGFDFIVKHPDYSKASTWVEPNQQVVIVTLSPGKGVRGRILDEAGKPIAGAEVRAWAGSLFDRSPSGERGWKTTVRSDPGGNFVIPTLDTKGKTWLFVKADGFAYYGRVWKSVPQEELEIVLAKAAPLFGFLVDAEGKGVANTTVEISGQPAFGEVTPWETLSYFGGTYRQVTKEDGSFRFPSLEDGAYDLKAWGEPETIAAVHTGPDPVTMVLGRMKPGLAVVNFLVIDADTKKPISGAKVYVMHRTPGGGMVGGGNAVTDGAGRCRSKPLPIDDGFFDIHVGGYVPDALFLRDFSEGISEVTIELEPAVQRTILIQAEDELALLAEESMDSMGAVVLRRQGFVLIAFLKKLVPRSENGLGGFGFSYSSVKEGRIEFPVFPAGGGTLQIAAGVTVDDNGGRDSSPTLEVQIPAGTEDFVITLTMAQLRQLGLRD